MSNMIDLSIDSALGSLLKKDVPIVVFLQASKCQLQTCCFQVIKTVPAS